MSKEVGITVSKNDDFSEWYTQVIIKAELADYAPVKGLIVLRPDGYSITFKNRDESLEQIFGKTGITPSEMTKKLWKFIKNKRLGHK